jgi:Spy/CpxP family protein refolding chaperone
MTLRSQTRLKIWLVVLGVFILGGVTGAALDSVYRLKASGGRGGGGGEVRKDRMERMKSDLNLTDSQAEQIRAILDQTRNEYQALRKEVRPRYDALRQQARIKIRALLTPEQQQKFDAKVAEHDARRNEEDEH